MMNNNTVIYPYSTEHYLRRVMTGNIEQVRARIVVALETLGYDVLEEHPHLQARIAARGWANAGASADVLDYPRTLTIRFRPLNERTTQVTFDYAIKHPMLSRGEKSVVTREAEAIAELATARMINKMCEVCGTDGTEDSRFCRGCGAPLVSGELALELLQMTAHTRAAHGSVVAANISLMLTLLFAFLSFVITLTRGGSLPKPAILMLVIALISVLCALFSLPFAWRRLNRALKQNDKSKPHALPAAYNASPSSFKGTTTGSLSLPESNATSLSAPPFSVTDSTTELLPAAASFKQPIAPLRERQLVELRDDEDKDASKMIS